MPESENKVSQQPAFVLHTYPWRETSLIAEVLTQDYGRLSIVAKGAKRPYSQYRGLLSPFCPLCVSYGGKGEVKVLTRCEWQGTIILPDSSLMAAFYINELLVRLLTRNDPVPLLFSSYFETLRSLSKHEDTASCLRRFEMDLLETLGYGLPDVNEDCFYQFTSGDWREVSGEYGDIGVSGKILAALKSRKVTPEQDKEARSLMRDILLFYLEGRPLNTRAILSELKNI